MSPKQDLSKAPEKFIAFKEFIDDENKQAIGIRGKVWPGGQPIEVFLENDCEKAQNPRRPTFQKLREGVKAFGQKRKLTPGGLLRLRCGQDENGVFKTDWPNIVTYNQEQTNEQMRFGYVVVKINTPKEVWRAREELINTESGRESLSNHMKENQMVDSPQNRNRAVEAILAEKFEGKPRYFCEHFCYEPRSIMDASSRDELREKLLQYFSDEEFAPVKNETKEYRPVKPHLIFRELDENGLFTGKCHDFMPHDATEIKKDEAGKITERRFLTPEECVDKIVAELPDVAKWSVLPGRIYTHSLEQMTMGTSNANDFRIRQLSRLNSECCVRTEDGKSNIMAFNMGLKVSTGDAHVVSDLMYLPEMPAVNPAVLARNGKPLAMAKQEVSNEEGASISPR